MENTSPSWFPRKPAPSRINSQDYASLSPDRDDEHYDDAAVSLISSRQDSINVSRPTLDRTSADTKAYSSNNNNSVMHKTEQYEAIVTSVDLDTVDKNAQPQSRFQDIREIVTKFWLWEVAACVFSLMSLASIVGVLIYEDGKQLDQWAWSIPPTAVVSFIGTMGKSSLVLVISQLLSQLKWLHFNSSNTRSLQHLRIFDGGSRGPLGALSVLYNSKKLLASIAACLMILTILVDPFVQLVFTFPSRLVEDGSQQAIFQRVYNWSGEVGPFEGVPSQRLWLSMNQGLTSTNTNPTAICPTGNCIWPEPIKTLAVCGSCTDVTPVNVNCSTINPTPVFPQNTHGPPPFYPGDIVQLYTCDYRFNNSPILRAQEFWLNETDPLFARTLWSAIEVNVVDNLANDIETTISFQINKTKIELNGQYDSMNTEFYDTGPEATYMQNYTPVTLENDDITTFNVIQLPNGEQRSFVNSTLSRARCSSCQMRWCEKTFENVRSTGNAPPTYKTSVRPLWFIDGSTGEKLGLYPDDVSTLNSSAVWNLRYWLQPTLAGYLSTLLSSYYAQAYDETLTAAYLATLFNLNESENGLLPTQLDLNYNPGALQALVFSSDDLNTTFSRLADALSECIRTGPDSVNAIGQALVSKSFVHVRWVWLALPLALIAITCILLPIVAVKSRSEKVAAWKNDPLALLFHHVDDAIGILPPESDSKTGPTDLNNLADELYVKLDRDRPFTFIRSAGQEQENIT